MDPITLGILGSGLVNTIGGFLGAGQQANAATQAAAQQAQAMREAARIQQQQYQQTRQDLSPYMQAGGQAVGQLGSMLSSGQLTPTMSAQGGMQYTQGLPQYQEFGISPMQQYQQASQPLNVNMSQDPGYQERMRAGINALEGSAAARGGLFSGATGRGITDYAQQQASQEYQNAYNRAALERQNQQQAYSTAYAQNLQGQGQQYSQALGSAQLQNQAYNQALQNELAQQGQQYNQLYGMAGMGQQAAGQLGSFGSQSATNVGQYNIGAAQAMGQGQQAAAGFGAGAMQNFGNQLASGLGSYLNYNLMRNAMQPTFGPGY